MSSLACFAAPILAVISVVPAPRQALPQAHPVIQYVRFSSTHVRLHSWWSGRFVTTTNVASLVISLPFFSFEIPRSHFGEFSFRTYVQAVPPLYRQTLHGSLIAYTANGTAVSQPLEISFR